MKKIFLKNAYIVDPSSNFEDIGTIVIQEDKIISLAKKTEFISDPEKDEIIDCTGKTIFPGLIDMHVFMEYRPQNQAASIKEISEAAARGGITSLLVIPHEKMPLDDIKEFKSFMDAIKKYASINIYPCAALKSYKDSKSLCEYGLLRKEGAFFLSNSKTSLEDSALLYQAMLYGKNFDMKFILNPQAASLIGDGVANDGLMANWLGLSPITKLSEIIPLERDLRLAQTLDVSYHAAQISCKEAVDILKSAKQKNKNISAGVSINHLLFNENDLGEYDTNFKFLPPLRNEDDRLSLVQAIEDGIIDVIVSAHDPQSKDKKNVPFPMAENGAIGLETLLAACLQFFHNKRLSLTQIIKALATNPARLLNVNAGALAPGSKADLIIVDLEYPWIVNEKELHTKATNTPFLHSPLQGRVEKTFVNGQLIFSRK